MRRPLTVASAAQEHSDDDLIDALVAGDAGAYRVAVRRYGSAMYAVARAISTRDAEDAVQDAWLAAFQGIARFGRRSSLKTWLLRICANKAVSRLRARRDVNFGSLTDAEDGLDLFDGEGRWRQAPPEWREASPEALLSSEALGECLDKHLGLLPPQQRIALVLRDIEDLPMEDVCGTLGVSPENGRVLLHRARMRMMRMVDTYQENGEC